MIDLKRLISILILIVCSCLVLSAQTGQLYTQQTTQGQVELKWYSNSLLYPKGVDIYRQKIGNNSWEKINTSPILKGNIEAGNKLNMDNQLKAVKAIIDKTGAEGIQGFEKLIVLIKSFTSTDLAKFMGIYYLDTDVKKGERYIYKVENITGGGNTLIAYSDTIVYGKPQKVLPPLEIKPLRNENKVNFVWRPETDRYFGTNVYRRTNKGEFLKLNQNPVMVSKSKGPDGIKSYPSVFFMDDSLQYGNTYTYKFTSLDFFGDESAASDEFTLKIEDTKPPFPPRNVKVKTNKNTGEVQLKWHCAKAKDLAGYHVFRKPDSLTSFIKISEVFIPKADKEYTDKPEIAGHYQYYVTAIDTAGNQAYSDTVQIHSYIKKTLTAVSKLSCTSDTGFINLSWEKLNNPDCIGYQIFRANSETGNYFLLNATPMQQTNFTDSLPINSKSIFYYKIVALDSAFKKGPFSEIVHAQLPDILPPSAPIIKKISGKGNAASISWVFTGTDAVGANLYRYKTGEVMDKAQKLNTENISKTTTGFLDKTIAPGAGYNYFLQTYDAAGNLSQKSNIYTFRVLPQDSVIGAIQKFRVKQKDKYHVVDWKLNKTENLKGVIVYRSENGGNLRHVSGLLRSSTFKDTRIKKSSTYEYQIRIFNTKGKYLNSKKIEIKSE